MFLQGDPRRDDVEISAETLGMSRKSSNLMEH